MYVCCMYVYVFLDINPLLDKWFLDVFSHLVGCHFIMLMVFFDVQKLFSLM